MSRENPPRAASRKATQDTTPPPPHPPSPLMLEFEAAAGAADQWECPNCKCKASQTGKTCALPGTAAPLYCNVCCGYFKSKGKMRPREAGTRGMRGVEKRVMERQTERAKRAREDAGEERRSKRARRGPANLPD